MYTIVINGITYTIINVLLMIMTAAGPTDVAGTKGTTAGFLDQGSAQTQRSR